VPHDEEVAALRRRIAELEAERDEYAHLNDELFVLQQVFSTMSSTLEIDDILATVLRGIHQVLRFGRVVLFDVGDGRVARRLETGEDGAIVPSPDPGAWRDEGQLGAMVRGDLEVGIGAAADPGPLGPADGAWCMLPLVSRNTVRGILYADRSADPEISESQVRMLLDFASQAAIALENARLYGETKRLLDETSRMAQTDPLTGLLNRRALGELLDRELCNGERYDSPLAFLVLDLDGLKLLNDTQGHRAGDEALRRFASTLSECARCGDIVSRYGGDEFVLVLLRCSRAGAEAVLARLFRMVERLGLGCSAGVAFYPRDGRSADALFSAADRALYAVKQAGKRAFRFAGDGA